MVSTASTDETTGRVTGHDLRLGVAGGLELNSNRVGQCVVLHRCLHVQLVVHRDGGLYLLDLLLELLDRLLRVVDSF